MHPEIWIAKKEIQEIARKYVSDTGQFLFLCTTFFSAYRVEYTKRRKELSQTDHSLGKIAA